jgi:Uma2 family endonuclease
MNLKGFAMAAVALLTAEEYAVLPEEQTLNTELERGVIVPVNWTRFRQGEICSNVASALGDYVRPRKLGRITSNDSGVVTERDPDTVRGPDVAYFSYARLPREVEVELYPEVMPDLAVEVRSPDDRWSKFHKKVGEYLSAGTSVVLVLDYEARAVNLFYSDKPTGTLTEADELTLPEVLADFRVPVSQLFE